MFLIWRTSKTSLSRVFKDIKSEEIRLIQNEPKVPEIHSKYLGMILILRNQKDWVGGFGQMIMFDYGLGGWVWQDDYVIMAMKKNAISQKR